MIRILLLSAFLMGTMGTPVAVHDASAGEPRTTESALASNAQAPQARIVLITASQACPCKLRLCKSGEQELKMALAAYPDVPTPKVIDDVKAPEQVRMLSQKYGVHMLPAVLFLDQNGTLKQLYQGDIKRENLKRSIARYCSRVK